MFSGNDIKHYICAQINTLGFNVRTEKTRVNLSQSGDNYVGLRVEFQCTELNKLVDMYVDELIKSNAPYLQTEPLRVKLKYFLQVFETLGYGTFILSQSEGSKADIGFYDICDFVMKRIELLCSTPESIRDKYISMMAVDGKVLIAKHVLKYFYHSEFLDFIGYCRGKLVELLGIVYWTLVDVSRTYSLLSKYDYSRKLNDRLTLTLRIDVTTYSQSIQNQYVDCSLVDGVYQHSRKNEVIIALFQKAASGDSVPVVIDVEVTTIKGEVVYSTSLEADAAYSRKAVKKIINRKQVLKDSFSVIRSLLEERC